MDKDDLKQSFLLLPFLQVLDASRMPHALMKAAMPSLKSYTINVGWASFVSCANVLNIDEFCLPFAIALKAVLKLLMQRAPLKEFFNEVEMLSCSSQKNKARNYFLREVVVSTCL